MLFHVFSADEFALPFEQLKTIPLNSHAILKNVV